MTSMDDALAEIMRRGITEIMDEIGLAQLNVDELRAVRADDRGQGGSGPMPQGSLIGPALAADSLGKTRHSEFSGPPT
jgi:hypothetical protein